jgi:hypothetical protein
MLLTSVIKGSMVAKNQNREKTERLRKKAAHHVKKSIFSNFGKFL